MALVHIRKVEAGMIFSFLFFEITTFNYVAYLIKKGLKAATIQKIMVAVRKAHRTTGHHPEHLMPEMM